jgi:hypothetical protein
MKGDHGHKGRDRVSKSRKAFAITYSEPFQHPHVAVHGLSLESQVLAVG